MPARSRARRRALDVLFESELQSAEVGGTLRRRVELADPPLNEYTVELVEGVARHLNRIDELITTYAEGWTLARMPVIDRNVLRMAAFEILYRDDIPDPVAIDEAVTLARALSTDESPGFVNGLLARIVDIKPTLPA